MWTLIHAHTVPHPDVFLYCLNGMDAQKNAPKKVLVTLFPYIFHIKPKWNIVYEYLKTKLLSTDSNILPQMHWTSNIFDTQLQLLGVFGFPVLNPIHDGGGQKGPPIRFSSVTSTNVGISPQNFLTFSLTLLPHWCKTSSFT